MPAQWRIKVAFSLWVILVSLKPLSHKGSLARRDKDIHSSSSPLHFRKRDISTTIDFKKKSSSMLSLIIVSTSEVSSSNLLWFKITFYKQILFLLYSTAYYISFCNLKLLLYNQVTFHTKICIIQMMSFVI